MPKLVSAKRYNSCPWCVVRTFRVRYGVPQTPSSVRVAELPPLEFDPAGMRYEHSTGRADDYEVALVVNRAASRAAALRWVARQYPTG